MTTTQQTSIKKYIPRTIKFSTDEGLGTVYHPNGKIVRDYWLIKSMTFNLSDKKFTIYEDTKEIVFKPFSESQFFNDLYSLPLQNKSITEHITSLNHKLSTNYKINNSLISTLVRLLRSRVLICSCSNHSGIEQKNCYSMFIRDLAQQTLNRIIKNEISDTRTKCKDCGKHSKGLLFCNKCKNFTCSKCVTKCKSCNKIYCLYGSHTSNSCKQFMTSCSFCPKLFCKKCCNLHIDSDHSTKNKTPECSGDTCTVPNFPIERIDDWCEK